MTDRRMYKHITEYVGVLKETQRPGGIMKKPASKNKTTLKINAQRGKN